MKCDIMLHFIRVYTVDQDKKKYNIFLNYNLTSLDMYNGLSQVFLHQTRRKNPLVYEGLFFFWGGGGGGVDSLRPINNL